jgi:type VI secretion system secreted protein VgrG
MASDRSITVTTPLPEGALLFEQMSGREALGRLFEYQVDLLSKDPELNTAAVLGKPMTVRLRGDGDKPDRHFNGIVARFSLAGLEGEFTRYRATLRPWFWLLTRTSNCRIFQHGKSVPDVIQEVFRDHGFTDFDATRLSGSYRKWDFLVQYRETDFNFVSRIMEQEGIYYYFTHEAAKHKLVLADAQGSHDVTPGYEVVPYFPPDPSKSGMRQRDHIDTWSFERQVVPGKYFVDDFNFESPRGDLKAKASAPQPGANAGFEIYDYPGEYKDRAEADAEVRIRLEARHAEYETFEGAGDARGLFAGGLFKLSGHPRPDQEKEYLLTSVTHVLATSAYRSDVGAGIGKGDEYRCTFTAVEGQRPFRSPSATPKPVVQGPQTAIVVGPGGEEIWTDKFGRVMVQFPWDRFGASNEKSSCWVRVAQVWAGAKWGAMHIPRIGQEVIVDFLEGDPDRPIITGRVYNADNMPPYTLPDNKTQSGIKSRSSKGGGPSNFNEIRFEDKKGSEELFVQAEKDHNTLVKNNQGLAVGVDRAKSVRNNETVQIGNNRTETVGADETISIGGSRSETVAAMESVTVGGNRTLTVAIADANVVGASHSLTVGGNDSTSVGGNQGVGVGRNQNVSVGGSRSVNVAKDETQKVGGKRTLSVAKDDMLEIGSKLSINVKEEISIKTGDATIVLKKNGDITIKGKNITLEASGKINGKASSDVIFKGSKIAQN